MIKHNTSGGPTVCIQRVLAWLFLPFVYIFLSCWMVWHRGYQIPELKKLRSQYRSILKAVDGPLIICANHLTYLDSVIMIYAFGSMLDYWLYYYTFPWNFPKARNAQKSVAFRFFTYLGKCILMPGRHSPIARKNTQEIARQLLERGDHLMVFPEGTCSDSGRVNAEDYGYGVGRLLMQVKNAKVLCAYQRGQGQKRFSIFPGKKEIFSIKLKLVDLSTQYTKLKAERDLSSQIMAVLMDMEKDYFESVA